MYDHKSWDPWLGFGGGMTPWRVGAPDTHRNNAKLDANCR
jgi:hypothetical protein